MMAEDDFGEVEEMSERTLNPQYVLDKSGKKAFVVLPVDECESLLEDLQDLAVIAERRDEAKISLEECERSLKADGLL
jgi:PHD/YefM family antitoxin component YafN of YafNO toxin-antitoxin module